jgi:hypothetical protein
MSRAQDSGRGDPGRSPELGPSQPHSTLLLQNWHRAFNEAEAAHGQHFNNNHVQKEIANEIALVID